MLLSQHPFVGLFSRAVSMLGPAYFDVGQPMLEAACASIASWYDTTQIFMCCQIFLIWPMHIRPPDRNGPRAGHSFDLPLLGTVLQVEIPYPHKPQLLETSRFDLNTFKPETQVKWREGYFMFPLWHTTLTFPTPIRFSLLYPLALYTNILAICWTTCGCSGN